MDKRISLFNYHDGVMGVKFEGRTLSTNIEGAALVLKPGEFLAKDWSENLEFAKLALASGAFIDSGFSIPSGFVRVPVWKIKDFKFENYKKTERLLSGKY